MLILLSVPLRKSGLDSKPVEVAPHYAARPNNLLMNSIGWLGGGAGAYAVGVAAPIFGMSGCLSANSVVYLCVGVLMVFGIRAYLNGKPVAAPAGGKIDDNSNLRPFHPGRKIEY